MTQTVAIFEDAVERFGSLALARPVFELKCGVSALWERIARHYPGSEVVLLCREYLRKVLRQELAYRGAKARVEPIEVLAKSPTLYLNGRIFALSNSKLPLASGPPEAGIRSNELLYLRAGPLEPKTLGAIFDKPTEKRRALLGEWSIPLVDDPKGIELVDHIWRLVVKNGEALRDDFKILGESKPSSGYISGEASFVNREKRLSVTGKEISARLSSGENREIGVYVGEGSWIDPGVVFDTTEGPVYIGRNVLVKAFSKIDGPSAIGDGSTIDSALVREGSTIGPVCRIGGEVEASIVHGFSNKHHEGFLGHAYVGEWVNIGAMATNSDLKNNYHSVRVFLTAREFAARRGVDSGEFKNVGIYVGDHTKVGISVALNAGTHLGVGCNVYYGEPVPKYVPSFSWGSGGRFVVHDIDLMLETARTVMARRKRTLTDEGAEMLRHVFELTAEDRRIAGVKEGPSRE